MIDFNNVIKNKFIKIYKLMIRKPEKEDKFIINF